MPDTPKLNVKLTPEQFVFLAIERLTVEGKQGFVPSWGTSERASFNELFADLYPESNSQALIDQMAKDGRIVILPRRTKRGTPYILVCRRGTETDEQRQARYAAKKAERETKREPRGKQLLKDMGLE